MDSSRKMDGTRSEDEVPYVLVISVEETGDTGGSRLGLMRMG